MNAAIEKRLARAEDELLSKELPRLRILFELGPDANAEALATHRAELADARSKGEQAILIGACRKKRKAAWDAFRQVAKQDRTGAVVE